ncbi:hypothetical protein [Microbacterium sp.]|uniref:hypothetical protein n=1 Tax=Microbacterium sp. TaxID=51671 RepID=UPI003A90E4E4
MRLSSTSSQRTYRYLRVALVGAAAVLGIGLAVVVVTDGPVTSISALYYTSGQTVFVGALCAIALALVALSGHSVEQVLLDVAAVFAAMIAVIPTPVGAGDVPGPGPDCAGAGACVPEAAAAVAHTGVVVLGVVAILGAITALVLARVQRTATPGVLVGAGAAAVAGVGLLAWLAAAPHALLAAGHLAATGVFFGLMVAVAIVSAVAHSRYRVVYVVVAAGMVACLLYLFGVELARLGGADLAGVPWVLFGEVGLIALFAVFWIAQTVQKWDETDPSILPAA